MNAQERKFTTTADRWSDEQVQLVIDTWNSPPEEAERLWRLQKSLQDVDHWKNKPGELMRYLRGPQGPDNAEQLFRDMIEWRIENGIDTLLQDYKPPQALVEHFPSVLLKGTDRSGDPVRH